MVSRVKVPEQTTGETELIEWTCFLPPERLSHLLRFSLWLIANFVASPLNKPLALHNQPLLADELNGRRNQNGATYSTWLHGLSNFHTVLCPCPGRTATAELWLLQFLSFAYHIALQFHILAERGFLRRPKVGINTSTVK